MRSVFDNADLKAEYFIPMSAKLNVSLSYNGSSFHCRRYMVGMTLYRKPSKTIENHIENYRKPHGIFYIAWNLVRRRQNTYLNIMQSKKALAIS